MKCEDFIRTAKKAPEYITYTEKVALIFHFKVCDRCSRIIREFYAEQEDQKARPVKIVRITVDESNCLDAMPAKRISVHTGYDDGGQQ